MYSMSLGLFLALFNTFTFKLRHTCYILFFWSEKFICISTKDAGSRGFFFWTGYGRLLESCNIRTIMVEYGMAISLKKKVLSVRLVLMTMQRLAVISKLDDSMTLFYTEKQMIAAINFHIQLRCKSLKWEVGTNRKKELVLLLLVIRVPAMRR